MSEFDLQGVTVGSTLVEVDPPCFSFDLARIWDEGQGVSPRVLTDAFRSIVNQITLVMPQWVENNMQAVQNVQNGINAINAAAGGDYWFCRINGNGAAAATYSVTEVVPPAWGVKAGGLGPIDVLNLAEEAAGTNWLEANAAGEPRVVVVFTQEDPNGVAVYCFRRAVVNVEQLTDFASISTGASLFDIEYNAADALVGETRALYRFPRAPVGGGALEAFKYTSALTGTLTWGPVPPDAPFNNVYTIETQARFITADFDTATVAWPGPATTGVIITRRAGAQSTSSGGSETVYTEATREIAHHYSPTFPSNWDRTINYFGIDLRTAIITGAGYARNASSILGSSGYCEIMTL